MKRLAILALVAIAACGATPVEPQRKPVVVRDSLRDSIALYPVTMWGNQ